MNIKKTENDYLIFYKQDDGFFRIYNCYDKTFKTGPFPYSSRAFMKFKDPQFPKSDEGLKDYAKMFKVWCKELKDATKLERSDRSIIDYSDTMSDFFAIKRLFNWFCKKNYDNNHKIEKITYQ
jgi:hypothetical protein